MNSETVNNPDVQETEVGDAEVREVKVKDSKIKDAKTVAATPKSAAKSKDVLKNSGKIAITLLALVAFLDVVAYLFETRYHISGYPRLLLTISRATFPILGFILLKKQTLTPSRRKWILFLLVIFAGALMPIEPNPMDSLQQIFNVFISEDTHGLPGVVGATIVMLLANKIACGWACQLGALQDLIFRLNRNKRDNKGLIKQYKVPFKVTNTIRIIFTIAVIFSSMVLLTDLYTIVDPIFVFDPSMVGITGLAIVVFVLVASLFVYRPWCYFFCPFGLLGWFTEKYSKYKIQIDRTTCTSCKACQRACPSNTMEAILNNQKTVPDCFMCGTCISACPKGSVSFGRKGKKPIVIDGGQDNAKNPCAS